MCVCECEAQRLVISRLRGSISNAEFDSESISNAKLYSKSISNLFRVYSESIPNLFRAFFITSRSEPPWQYSITTQSVWRIWYSRMKASCG